MPHRFLSTRNDFKLALVFGVLMFLLIFTVEFVFLETPGSSGGEGGGVPPGEDGEGPTIEEEDIIALATSGSTSEGQTASESFTLDEQYGYSITVTLTWTDDVGSNDRFGVILEQDGTTLGSGQGNTGSITFDVNDNNEGDLNGTFSISVTAEECPGVMGSHALDRDNGNAWDLSVSALVGREVQEGEV